MKFKWMVAALVLLAGGVAAADKAPAAEIVLSDGQKFKAARIVTLGEKTVTISHAEGVTVVAIELVPLDLLGRAHLDLQAKAAERKKTTDDLAARATERIRQKDAKKDEEIRLRLATANARAQVTGEDTVAVTSRMTAENERKLAAVKASFPPVQKHSVFGASGEKFEVEVPSAEMWTAYRTIILATTIPTVTATLRQVDEKMTADMATLTKLGAVQDVASSAQARKSSHWLNTELRTYLATLKAL